MIVDPYVALNTSYLAKNVSQSALQTLAQYAKLKNVKPHEVIIDEGAKPHAFYIIVDGDFDVMKMDHVGRQQHVITTLTKNTVLGEISLIDSLPRSATVRAKTSGAVFVFSFSSIANFAKHYPADYLIIIKNIGKIISKNLRKTNDITATSFTANVDSMLMRIKMANFIIAIISALCIYSFTLAFTFQLVRSYNTDALASLLTLIVIIIPSIVILKYNGGILNTIGICNTNWRTHLLESVLLTLPILILITLFKWILINNIPLWQAEKLFYGPLIIHKSYALLLLLMYLLSCPIQEFIARGILQESMQKFLVYKTAWPAILYSNLVFSNFHLYLSLSYAIATFIPGIFFGWLYARQRSLLGPTVSHMIIGVWSIYILGLTWLVK